MTIVIARSAVPSALGDWSDVAPLGPNDGQLDGGNVDFQDPTGRIDVSAYIHQMVGPRTAVIVIAGQSYGTNAPATDPYWQPSIFSPTAPVYQLNVFTGQFLVARDPLLGMSGIGGTMWTRMAQKLVASGQYDNVVLVPLDVGGSSVGQWAPGGAYFRKLEVGMRELQDAGVNKVTQFIWEHGLADSGLLPPDFYQLQLLNGVFGTLRAHGMTAPIYMAQNAVSDGTATPAVGGQYPFAQMQNGIASQTGGSGILTGVNFDQIPGSDYATDGHFTTTGLVDAGSEWAGYLQGIPAIAAVNHGLVARTAGGPLAEAVNANGVLTPSWLPEDFSADWSFVGSGIENDLFFKNASTAMVAEQQISTGAAAALQYQVDMPIVCLGDFNNDGHTDLVYQKPGIAPVIQEQNGFAEITADYVHNWAWGSTGQVVGTVQATKSTETDLVVRDRATGQYGIQSINGANDWAGWLTSQPWGGPQSDWRLIGAADFRGIGRDGDLVFYNSRLHLIETQSIDLNLSVTGGTIPHDPFDGDPNWQPVAVQGHDLIEQRLSDGLLEHVTVGSLGVTGGGQYNVATTGSFALNSLFGNHSFVPGT
jgi:hypothetical protein